LSLRSQRRIAAEILKVGINRVWIDPEHLEDVEIAITREEIRKLVHEGAIRPTPKVGVSRVRARILHQKKRKGLRSGSGSKSGASHAKITKKQAWMQKIRAQRRTLREWKAKRALTEGAYRQLYMVAGSGAFGSVADMERYARTHGLWRKR
jgi:large subunit ribosomal protein L19e